MGIVGPHATDARAAAPTVVIVREVHEHAARALVATQTSQVFAEPVGIIGAGYVGLVLTAAFAARGRPVLLVESNPARLATLGRGECPIVEPGVDDALRTALHDGRLTLTGEQAQLVGRAPFIFLCVGTPGGAGGRVDMRQVEHVADALLAAPRADEPPILLIKSTVPVGTGDSLQALLGDRFHVVNNPEFLREGSALADTSSPARTIIGTEHPEIANRVRALYDGFGGEFIVTGRREAEMIKYATNALLAMRLSAANEIATIAEALGVNATAVLQAVGRDPRIGSQYMNVGIGYGGSCLPKDVAALTAIADSVAVEAPVLRAAVERNRMQRETFMMRCIDALGSPVGKTVGVWGLSFKGGTDDLRESPALSIATGLAATGARVRAYDPAYRERAGGHLESLVELVDSADEAARDAHLLLVMTDWAEFATADWSSVAQLMAGRLVLDGRNCVDRASATAAGLSCYAVGVGESDRVHAALDLRETRTVASASSAARPSAQNSHPQVADVFTDGRQYLAALPPESVEKAGPRRRPSAPSNADALGKRGLDIAMCAAVLTLASPVIVLFALAILLETGRPVLFRAKRVGRDGRSFTMYKFRSMRIDAAPYAHKTKNNPAVTGVGRLLRTTSFDELPQLWNVLKGDMSLVGPRPEQPFIVDWYQPWQAERLRVPPGITGWWQIKARGQGLMYQHIEYDVWYARHRSFMLDLAILFRTPLALLRGTDRR
jgi:UDPglucose 6-dehydrogenase